MLPQNLEDAGIQRTGGGKIAAKRLFDDDAPPIAFFFFDQSGFTEAFDDHPEQLRSDREVEQHIAAGLELGFDGVEQIAKPRIGVGGRKIASKMSDTTGDEVPSLRIKRFGVAARGGIRDKASDPLGQVITIGVGRFWRAVSGDDREFVG